MTERIDHAAESRKHIEWAHEQQGEEGRYDETVQHNATLAVAEATLALVEQARIANLIALGQVTIGPDCSPVMLGAVWPGGQLRPEIKEGLGL